MLLSFQDYKPQPPNSDLQNVAWTNSLHSMKWYLTVTLHIYCIYILMYDIYCIYVLMCDIYVATTHTPEVSCTTSRNTTFWRVHFYARRNYKRRNIVSMAKKYTLNKLASVRWKENHRRVEHIPCQAQTTWWGCRHTAWEREEWKQAWEPIHQIHTSRQTDRQTDGTLGKCALQYWCFAERQKATMSCACRHLMIKWISYSDTHSLLYSYAPITSDIGYNNISLITLLSCPELFLHTYCNFRHTTWPSSWFEPISDENKGAWFHNQARLFCRMSDAGNNFAVCGQ